VLLFNLFAALCLLLPSHVRVLLLPALLLLLLLPTTIQYNSSVPISLSFCSCNGLLSSSHFRLMYLPLSLLLIMLAHYFFFSLMGMPSTSMLQFYATFAILLLTCCIGKLTSSHNSELTSLPLSVPYLSHWCFSSILSLTLLSIASHLMLGVASICYDIHRALCLCNCLISTAAES